MEIHWRSWGASSIDAYNAVKSVVADHSTLDLEKEGKSRGDGDRFSRCRKLVSQKR